MKHILIIEDDPTINGLLLETLTDHQYQCTQAFSGTEGLMQLQHGSFDLILLDLMLPGLSGKELLQKVKPDCLTPVIVLSARDELDSKVDLLTLGAEDYITKPFAIRELLARIEVQLRRTAGTETASDILHYGELTLDRKSFQVQAGGTPIPLTKREFAILELLISHPQQVFTKQEIYDHAWDSYYMGEDKTINVHISNIRKKLAAATAFDYIETVWGIGFRITPLESD